MKRYCCENFEQAVSEGEIKEDDLSPTVYYIAGVFMNLYLYHCPFCGTDLREQKKPATLNRYYDIEEVA